MDLICTFVLESIYFTTNQHLCVNLQIHFLIEPSRRIHFCLTKKMIQSFSKLPRSSWQRNQWYITPAKIIAKGSKKGAQQWCNNMLSYNHESSERSKARISSSTLLPFKEQKRNRTTTRSNFKCAIKNFLTRQVNRSHGNQSTYCLL